MELLLKACPVALSTESSESPEEAKLVSDKTTDVDGHRVRVVVTESSSSPQKEAINLAEVALRWLIHHSYLREGDGIIIGVSKQTHLVANLAAWKAGPLPDSILEACEEAWELSRPSCEAYFRGYGAKAGGIEAFLALQDEPSKDEPEEKKRKLGN